MAKALIVFGSTTGNTENAAHTIAKAVAERNIEARVMDVSAMDPAEFDRGYQLFLLGCSTWGDEEIELQEDFAEFAERMDQIDLNDRKVAVFGCGDSSYTHFCGAVDVLEEKAEELGAELVVSGLRIDGDPEDSEDEIKEWAHSVAAEI